ncbi:MAG: 30S ribosomal protein S12 methylthiotransferase RimO [Clostridia bacterium]|nr:30S ribosomal protein S12 methylthiotransferase RimO [Clostridia bacterium]
MAIKVGMVSLGCAKNQVDGEMLMASLKNAGFELHDDAALADIAIVNTCGFIESAKQESIDEILELATLKKEGRIKKLVVTGCLAERYQEEIHKELPEVDGVFGIGANGDIGTLLAKMWNEGFTESFPEKEKMPLCGDRELSTPSYFAYIKIAEGCDNKCTYCAIPMIRGGFRSRTMESIEEEARALVENGAKELILIAQDTTRYGLDLYGKYSLAELMRRLCKIEKLQWLRVLYCYPDAITDELLDVMAEEDKIVKYIDLPLQHAAGKVLKAMNRRGDKESLLALVRKIRAKMPDVTLRTTLITGFPGETEEDFTELAEFVKEAQFERLGCFTYSQEEDTIAGEMEDQIDEEVKAHRAELIYESQMLIMERLGERHVGTDIEVLTEGFDRYAECWFGRSRMDAPDTDGKVFFTAEKKPYLGQMVTVHVDEAIDCDLFGVRV